MGRSFLIFASIFVCVALCSCSIFEFGDEQQQPAGKAGAGAAASAAPKIDRTATLTITPGIRALNVVALPAGFAPIPSRPPMWLENGQEIGIVGIQNGQIVVLGFSGAGWQSYRVITAETGRESAEPGNIVDVQPSPDGLTLAYAVALPGQYRLDIVLRDLIATGPGIPVASFDGLYDSATMHWLNGQTIAVALRLHPGTVIPPPQPPADEPGAEPEPAPKPVDGLQVVVITGPGSVAPLKLNCTMMRLDWSPRGIFAIGDGGGEMPPILIDRRRQTCRNFIVPWPIRVLAWEPNSDSSFLYQGPDPTRRSRGVYKYDLAAGEGRVVAVSSGAGAYTSTGAIITLGNQKLTFRMAEERRDLPLNAEIAIVDAQQNQTSLKSLGFQTTPELLARSTMAFSSASNRAAIEAFAPGAGEPIHKIITYSVERDNAFLIAQGPDRGNAVMSWSPRGRWLALVDGDASGSTLAIIQPPD